MQRPTIALMLLLLCLAGLAAPTLADDESDTACTVTLEVKSCSGEIKTGIVVEIAVDAEGGGKVHRATTDAAGQATLGVCAETVEEVDVYLFEDAPPMSSSPIFEEQPEDPAHVWGIVILC